MAFPEQIESKIPVDCPTSQAGYFSRQCDSEIFRWNFTKHTVFASASARFRISAGQKICLCAERPQATLGNAVAVGVLCHLLMLARL